jgi:large subunit ribosomal protein L29
MKRTQQVKELTEKDNTALYKELEVLNNKLVTLRFDVSFRKLKNLKSIRETRKQIARIWTILNSRAVEKIKTTVEKEKAAK